MSVVVQRVRVVRFVSAIVAAGRAGRAIPEKSAQLDTASEYCRRHRRGVSGSSSCVCLASYPDQRHTE